MTAFEQAWESLTPDLETPVEGSAITFEPSMSSNDECCEEAKANFLYRLSQIWADGESPVGFDLDDRFYTTYADKIGFNSPEWGQMTCENFRKTLEDLAADSIPDPKYGDVDWVKEIGFADERDGWGGFPPTMGFPKAQAATRQLAKDILREWDACSNAQLDDMGAVDMDENAIDEQRARDMDGASAFSKAWDVVKDEEEDPHADIPEEYKRGECYMCAGRHVWSNPETHTLVHANVTGQGRIEGARYGHAFTEFQQYSAESDSEKTMVYDPSADVTLPADFYYALGQINPDEVRRYSLEEMNKKLAETKEWGPWDD
jgi:hypothetical protein